MSKETILQKDLILQIVKENPGLTDEQILLKMKKHNPKIVHSTVNGTINYWKKLGCIIRTTDRPIRNYCSEKCDGISANTIQSSIKTIGRKELSLDPNLAASLLGYFYITIFRDDKTKSNSTQRYLSWEHCYSFFRKMREKYLGEKPAEMRGEEWEQDLDLMALHLGFYLASWGMYRGSSFFLQHDYKFHKKAIQHLFTNMLLWESVFENKDELKQVFKGHSDSEIKELGLLFDGTLSDRIKSCYFGNNSHNNNGNETEDEDTEVSSRDITQTQLTKILLGVCGCIPAYDRYFCEGVKKCGGFGTLSDKSFSQLVDYWNTNSDAIISKLDSTNSIPSYSSLEKKLYYYPPMKLVDMIFWQLGMLLSEIKAYYESEDSPKKRTIASITLYKTINTKNFDGLLSAKEMIKLLDEKGELRLDELEMLGDKVDKLYIESCLVANREDNSEKDVMSKCDFLLEFLSKSRKDKGLDYAPFSI